MRTRRLLKLCVYTVTVSFLLVGVAASSQAVRFRVGIPSETMAQIAIYSALENAYYSGEGLDVQLILMRAPVANMALIGGDVQFTTAGVSAISAAARGAPLKVIFNSFTRPLHWIYARPEIRSAKDMKGKRMGVDGRGAAMHYLVQDFFRRHGLEENRGDYVVMGVGVQSDRYGALAAGAVDAAILTFPFNFIAEKAGYRELGALMNEDIVQLQGAIAFDERLRQTDFPSVEKFMRATMKGLLFAASNRPGAISILTRRLRIASDMAARIYDLARPVMTEYGILSDELQDKALDLVFKTQGIKGPHPRTNFFDFSIAQRLKRELAGVAPR